jgi:hypothetical protein
MSKENLHKSLVKRFNERFIVLPNGCWEWQSKKDWKGYGVIGFGLKQYRAHRISYFIKHGVFPKNHGCHTCDNRLCVNPEHIFDGTAKDNTQDALNKGRLACGERHGRVKLSLQTVNMIKEDIKKNIKQQEIADKYNISQTQVHRIKSGKNWSRDTMPITRNNEPFSVENSVRGQA